MKKQSMITIRRDRNAISLFSRKDGTKMRFAIGDYDKATWPELVDVKITDWCDVGCSFCLDPDTLVTLDTMRRIPLRDVKVGDSIFAFGDPENGERYVGKPATVKAKWGTRKPSVLVKFDDGREVICSTDHRFLTSRMGWKQAWHLRTGDRVRCIAVTPEQEETAEYKMGYLAGFSRGDGAFRDNGHGANGRYIRLSCGDRNTIERIHSYMEDFGLNPNPIKNLWVPEGVKECWEVEKRSKEAVEWFAFARDFSNHSSPDYSRGFVGGFFDAEGSSNGMSAIRFHQKNDMEAQNYVISVLEKEGFVIGKELVHENSTTVNVSSTLSEVEKFCNKFIPVNTRRNRVKNFKNIGVHSFVTVTSVEPIGDKDLIDIETSTGTFFAEGLAVHNCYQDSTLFGKHATMDNMRTMVERFAKVKVQEIAYGGGETTGHPEFVEIMKMTHDAGIVPNFTTKKPAMVRKFWNEIKDYIGGFAYSAENAGQVEMAARVLKGHVPDDKVGLHYVMGLGDRQHFMDYMRAADKAGYRVTLLGYKTKGRGKDVIPHPYDWWIDAVNELVREGTCPTLSIDTPLAEQYDGKMPIGKHMYHTREGAFSMYVDAVSMEMGASSFDEKEVLMPFDDNWVPRYSRL